MTDMNTETGSITLRLVEIFTLRQEVDGRLEGGAHHCRDGLKDGGVVVVSTNALAAIC